MAEGSDGASKTEEATPRKLEDARRKGEGAKSSELSQAVTVGGAFLTLTVAGGWICRNLAERLVPFIAHPETMTLQGAAGVSVMRYAITAAAPALAVVLGATMLSGIAGNVLQTGLLFTPGRLAPDLSKLNPFQGLGRMFGIDGMVQFARAVAKVLITGAIAWWVLWPHAGELPGLATLAPSVILPYAAGLARALGVGVLLFMAGMGAVDFIWQRQRFLQKMRMTKEEVKEDHRQAEGDPHVKAKQRQIRNERARRRMIQAVPGATVVVMNPTHYAVALRYAAGVTPAPECVAKGVDEVALKIREVAEAAGVAIIEDPPLARALYAAVEVDQTIPHQHYEAVAKIIGFVLSASKSPKRARQL